MYKIIVEYETGDSFGSWDASDEIGPWTNLDIAKENLLRIKEHYEIYKDFEYSDYYKCNESTKRQFLNETGLSEIPRWLAPHWQRNIILLNDDECPYIVHVNWAGYFERLSGASIRRAEEDGWSFTT